MAKTVTIGCRLPHGLQLDNPLKPGEHLHIAGKNKSLIVGGQFGISEIDSDAWDAWLAINRTAPFVKNGALFACKSPVDAQAQSREMSKEKTGFEGLDPTAMGVKPATAE